jgi:glycosyltransferase involved in cell wall biosynthesis
MKDWPSTLIPYPLDTNHWFPTKKNVARESLGLNPSAHIILFGAIGGTTDSRKGADLLQEALYHYSNEIGCQEQQVEIAIFGQSEPTKDRISFPYPVHYFGSLNDNLSLRLLYSAADVMVVPSRLEAFGQTATESQACGTPVLAFRTGGLIDTVEHLETGYLADPFNPLSLSLGLRWILEDAGRLTELSVKARAKSVRLWNPDLIASMHHMAYQEILESRAPRP